MLHLLKLILYLILAIISFVLWKKEGSGPNSLDSLREMLSPESGKGHVRPQAALASG